MSVHKFLDDRRSFLRTAGAVTAALALPGQAQERYPQRPLRCIIPNAPGSSLDTVGRLVLMEVSRLLQQPVVADNRAGAAGALGVELGRTAVPDGYTLLLGSTSAITTAPLLQKAVSYEPLRDFELITLIAVLPNVLVCHPKLPVNSTSELIAWARSRAGASHMASAGIGSASHLAGAAFQSAAGFQSLHVPYKGGSQGVASVVSGETDWVLTPAPAAMSLVGAGRLRLLGHSMGAQTRPLGDVPSLASTVPGYEFSGWIGLLAPRGLPAHVTSLLSETVAQALGQPELRKAFESHGAVAFASGPQEFREFLTRDIALNRKAIAAAGIQPE